MIYLDHAAATPLDPTILTLMTPYMTEQFYNPSSLYLGGGETRKALDHARQTIARVMGAKATEIRLTSGGTEANNLAITGVMSGTSGKNIVISSIEHESVARPAEGFAVRKVAVQPDGRVNLDELRSRIDQDTAMVSIMYANNEIGTIQPLKEIAAIIRDKEKEYGTTIIFHTDAAQAGNYLDLHVARLGVDCMTLNSGKVYGPRAVGCLYVRSGVTIHPILLGGGQESGARSGTENVAGAIGFAAALQTAQQDKDTESRRLHDIRLHSIHELQQALPQSLINSPKNHCLPNTINLTVPSIDGEAVVMAMDQQGFQIATGSACHASNDLPSHVLLAIGRTAEEASASLRITMGRQTTVEDMIRFVSTLEEVVTNLSNTGYLVA